ncbi:MAG: flagellar motor protein MotB [Acidobacteriota bacterium]|nr:flagellar motor protein MotB [Acidobacteriota bacterium]
MANNAPIIIKKKGGHGGHHGGAWKVAYADFVTAMMALFIVLWLLSSSKDVKEAVGGYFKDPDGSSKMAGSSQSGSGQNITLNKDNMKEIKDALEKQVKALPDFEKLKKHIDMTITSEGLRIELSEGEGATFFESGSAVPSGSGKELLVALAKELGDLPNNISIEGHTDSTPYSGKQNGYSNWELSVDRGNAARRIMAANGIRGDQVSQVRGFADQRPRPGAKPDDPANRRISVIVLYTSKAADAESSDKDVLKSKDEAPNKQEKSEGGKEGEGAKGGEGHGEAKPSGGEAKH